MRDEDFPVLGAGIGYRRGQDLEILSVLVAADVEQSFAMVDIVAMFLFARQEHLEVALRLIRGQVARLGGISAVDIQNDEFLVAGAGCKDGVQLVFFLVNRIVLGVAQRMPPEMIGAFGDRVFGGQKQGLVVG